MALVETLLSVYQGAFTFISSVVSSFVSGLSVILKVNFEFASSVFDFCATGFSFVLSFVKVVCFLVYNAAVCLSELTSDVITFVKSFLFLVWKVVQMIYYFLVVVFHMLEYAACFIWTGGKRTAETLQLSAQTLTENSLNTWRYFVLSLTEFTNSIIGGFDFLGHCGKSVCIFVVDSITWCCESVGCLVYFVDKQVRECFLIVYELLSEFFLQTPKEVYMGILLWIIMYQGYRSIVKHLGSRGLTFPFFTSIPTEEYEEDERYTHNNMEFSDDDYGESIDENDDTEEDEESDNSSDDDFSESDEDDVEEFDVNSSDDNESMNSDGERSEINIELPTLDQRYNLRHSVTPCRDQRVSGLSSDEYRREIQSEKEKRLCIVCQDNNKSVLILPCKHLCLCVQCGNQIARSPVRDRRVCPLCRTRIRTIMNIYV